MDDARLTLATQAAAEHLAARGAITSTNGPTLSCAFTGSGRVVVRNSLQHVPAFSGEHLLQQVAVQIVQALTRQGD
jgi:hypothetical protein